MKMKVSFHDTNGAGNPYVKFQAGECYPQDADTLRRVAAGEAELVDATPAADAPASKPTKTKHA